MMARLVFDASSGRWTIGDRELHCGDCFHLFTDKQGAPIPVRIEHGSNGWCLISDYGFIQPSGRLAEVNP